MPGLPRVLKKRLGVIGQDGRDFLTIMDACPCVIRKTVVPVAPFLEIKDRGRCVIRREFWKNVELFVLVRGYGVRGGTHCTAWGVGGMGVSPAKLYI